MTFNDQPLARDAHASPDEEGSQNHAIINPVVLDQRTHGNVLSTDVASSTAHHTSSDCADISDFQSEEWAAMPPRSRLYRLTPLGFGTPYVESLTSYIFRLANAHSVRLQTLVKQEIAPQIKDRKLVFASGCSLLGSNAKCLNGINATTELVTTALEALTCLQNLRALSMTYWKGTISTQSLIRNHQAWCVKCLHEWQRKAAPLYYPLLWSINAVTLCPIHKTPLCKHCQNCGKSFVPFSARNTLGICPVCHGSLGSRSILNDNGEHFDQSRWDEELFKTAEICDLLHLAAESSGPSPRCRFRENIRGIIDIYVKRGRGKLGRATGYFNSYLYILKQYDIVPSLRTLTLLCWQLNISIRTLLFGVVREETLVGEGRSRSRRAPMARFKDRRKEYEERVTKALEEASSPPSVVGMCRRFGISRTSFLVWFPHLVKGIKEKRQDLRRQQRTQLVMRMKSVIDDLLRAEKEPSIYVVSRRLGCRALHLKFWFRVEFERLVNEARKTAWGPC